MIDLKTRLMDKTDNTQLNVINNSKNTELNNDNNEQELTKKSLSLNEFAENYYDVNDYYDTFISRVYNV